MGTLHSLAPCLEAIASPGPSLPTMKTTFPTTAGAASIADVRVIDQATAPDTTSRATRSRSWPTTKALSAVTAGAYISALLGLEYHQPSFPVAASTATTSPS